MERKEIINNLKRDGAWYRFNGIIFASVENLADEEIFKSYKAYKKRSGRKTFPGIKYYTYTEADTYLQFL